MQVGFVDGGGGGAYDYPNDKPLPIDICPPNGMNARILKFEIQKLGSREKYSVVRHMNIKLTQEAEVVVLV